MNSPSPRFAAYTIAMLVALTFLSIHRVSAGQLLSGYPSASACCPQCAHRICLPELTNVPQPRTVYHCNWKEICIPGIRGLFAKCDEPPRCGRVRTVTVLKKTEHKCDKCGYVWHIRSACGQL